MDITKKHITLVLGTGRKNRQSEHVAEYIQNKLTEHGFTYEFADIRDYLAHPFTIPDWEDNDATLPWRNLAKKSDGFIFVIPEYNHSFPGEFKLLLDQDFDNYKRKLVLLCTVSEGGFAGVRVHEQLQPILNNFAMSVVPAPLFFGKVEEFVKMSPEERDELHAKRVEKSFNLYKTYFS